MNVCGIDVSSRAVDYVKLPLDGRACEWRRVEAKARTAEDRLADMRGRVLQGSYWDDVAIVAFEWPTGHYRTGDKVLAFLGLVVANVPERLAPWYFRPKEWRAACGMSGNASKEQVVLWAVEHWPGIGTAWTNLPGDAFDAFCVAYAARALNEKASAA